MSRPPPNGTSYGYPISASNPSLSSSQPSNINVATNGAAMNSQTRLATMSRAERFEDEKRRIIESCFSKLDQNGQLAESYITHIRVQEDGVYPSTPSPPDADPSNKKPRLIIIAVRSTGRVRMHKARENNNGSFSIGKTWNLEELSTIENYSLSPSLSPPANDVEAQHRAWAGSVGFTVTITKPYYWQAGTAKEKEFFIASAVKIYRKYTKGQVPELKGFDEQQKAGMLGGLPGGQGQSPPPMQNAPFMAPDGSASPVLAPPQPAFAQEAGRSRSWSRSQPESPGGGGNGGGMNELPGSRSQSPAPAASRYGHGAADAYVPKPFASSERSYSPAGSHRERMPSTASGQASALPTPPPIRDMPPRSGSQQGMHPGVRSESPASAYLSQQSQRGGTGEAPVFAPPQRKASGPASPDGGLSPDRGMLSPSLNGSFAQQQTLPQRERDRPPPIETYSSSYSNTNNQQQRPPVSAAPRTGESTISSPGLSDPSAFAAASSFMAGPEQSVAGATLSSNSTATSEAAPPARSKRRPTLETTMSDTQLETMRPAPLNPNARSDSTSRSQFSTPTTDSFPLASQAHQAKNNSDSNLPIPGNIQRSAMQPSPLTTPAQTPGEQLQDDTDDTATDREAEEEAFRPGLGPMIKRKAVADRLKKAAIQANTFKPRPGGAAEKIMKAKADREAGEDDGGGPVGGNGVSGFVPRPKGQDLAVKAPIPAPPRVDISAASPITARGVDGLDGSTRGLELQDDEATQQPTTPDEKTRSERELRQPRKPAQVKIKRRSATQERYLSHLGIDRGLLADRCLDFESTLYDFGWSSTSLSPKALSEMESSLKREQSRLDAGTWLSAPSHEAELRHEREGQVMRLLDRAIQECDELDGLLTIYGVELGSLNEDISFIEAQSQGLQVQAANQRILQEELHSLVGTLSLDRKGLEALRNADLSTTRGIDDAEAGLKKLYQAIIAINPSTRSNTGRPGSRNGLSEGNELANMAAVRSKLEQYTHQSELFCQRLNQHLDYLFTTSFNNAKPQALIQRGGAAAGLHLNLEAFSNARLGMWKFAPMVLFMKELNPQGWTTSIRTYGSRARPLYADSFGQSVSSWKRGVKKATGDEAEVLFTTQRDDESSTSSGSGGGGIASTAARKLTVKRSQTLAKTLRKASDERPGSSAGSNRNRESQSGKEACEVFASAMDEMAPMVVREQNFIVDLFHTTSLENTDFLDAVAAAAPANRQAKSLEGTRAVEPDREMARLVTSTMEEVFGFLTNELSKLLDWALQNDPIQGVGIMANLSRHAYHLQDSGQEFLAQLIDTLFSRLQNLFAKFVDEQVRAIEDTKVKIKKRKGVIGFMRIFPHFALSVENTFQSVHPSDYDNEADSLAEVRKRVDEAYARLNAAMFDSLKHIAQDGHGGHASTANSGPPRTTAVGGSDDPEDKEKLNFNVLIIENMNHYVEEVDDGGRTGGVLAEWKGRAEMERAESLDSYVGQVIRRPLGKLLEYLDAISSVRASHPNNPSAITSRPSFSRKAARNVLSQYDAKEVRRGIDQLRARVEKHFGVGDDESICRALVALVSKECERAYENTITRVEEVVRELYPSVEGEKDVVLEFRREDVQGAFRR